MNGLRAIRIGLWAIVGLAAIAVVALTVGTGPDSLLGRFLTGGEPAAGSPGVGSVGGPFSLVNQRGETVTEAALKGHPSALFFGYTYCPDVCPTTLADLTAWMKELGPDADRLKVFFVTVDPERDTVEQMAAYLAAFDPRITGLTGPPPAIDAMLKEYRIYARKVPQEGGGYLMDHSAAVYLFDNNAAFTATVDYTDPPSAALAKLKRLVGVS
ncbi:MAG TPA: SCO family protein [Bauldia sp.]|nr:SCO family protein [Bauldia sp.]